MTSTRPCDGSKLTRPPRCAGRQARTPRYGRWFTQGYNGGEDSLAICPQCSAAVPVRETPKHDQWHDRMEGR